MAEYELYLCHHGVKGMKWGVRKVVKGIGKFGRAIDNTSKRVLKSMSSRERTVSNSNKRATAQNTDPHQVRVEKAKKALKIGAAVAGTALAVYGAKKLNDAMVQRSVDRYYKDIDRINRANPVVYQRYLETKRLIDEGRYNPNWLKEV